MEEVRNNLGVVADNIKMGMKDEDEGMKTKMKINMKLFIARRAFRQAYEIKPTAARPLLRPPRVC